MLVLDYGSEEDTLKKQYRAWYIENQQVKILFEGAAQRLAFDRDDGILSMVDLSDQKTDTPDTTREQLIKNSVYKAYDGPDVSLRLTVGLADEVGVPTIKQRVADFFLDVYQPTVPEGAPAWVGEYIKYIYTHLDGPYMTEEPDFWNHGTIQGMILYKAAPDSAPIMYVRDILPDGWLGEYYYLGGRGRYTAYHIYGLNDATIYDDEAGHTIIKLESSFTDWYIVGSAGWNQLFGEGWLSPVLPSAVYINGESADFELGEEENVGRWLEPRRMQAFVSNGMGSILLPQEGITYELAQTPATADADTEITPWNEVEQMLIDAFCDFARRTGQMK